MIGYKKNLDLFLHMSRKELQQLCKQHNLPANRSHAQLAKSLALFFKKRNVSSVASVEKASNSMDKFCTYSFVTEAQATQTNNFLKESARGGCGRFCHIGNQIGVTHMGSSTSDKPRKTLNALCSSCHGNQKGTEDFEHCNICLAADVQERRSNLGLESKEASIRSEYGKLLDSRNTEQKLILDTTRNSRTCKLMPCGHNRPPEYSTVSGFVSADEISTRSPSLQFFVMSEGGINLYVDLNSRPLEWINSLKDDVCVYQNAEHDESMTLSKHISDSPENDDHMKISPSTDNVMNLEDIGGEQNIGCSNSSMSSVVSENCGSEAYPVDTTVVTSGSSALTSGSIPAELSGCLEETQVVSSSCAAKSVQNHIISNVNAESYPVEGAQLIHDSINTSSLMTDSNASLPDASIKCIGNEDGGATNPLQIVASPPKTPSTDFVDAEDNVLSGMLTLNHIPDKDNIPMSMEMQESVETSSSHHLNDHSRVHEGPFMLGVNEHPDKVSPSGGLSGTDQLGNMVLDDQVGNAHSEMGAVDGPLYLQEDCTCGTLAPECPRSTFHDELGQRTPMRVKDTSDCSIVQTLDNSSKRSNSEFPEVTDVKRQNICGQFNQL